MSARHAVLGLLLDRPSYPYELSQRLRQRLGPTWEVNSGYMSRTIKALEKDGLIERVHAAPAGRASRKVYAITEAGIDEFQAWFPEGLRSLLVKITLAGPEHLQASLAKIDAYEKECYRHMKVLVRERNAVEDDGRLVRADHLLLRVNLSAEIFQLEAGLRWARHAREMVSLLQNSDAIWPSTREIDTAERESRAARRALFARMAASDRTDIRRPARSAGGD